MTSHHVICHVPLHHPKEKEKENQKKRNIKSRKIDKRKMLVSKHTITLVNSLKVLAYMEW